jgi:RNA-directed DNA polymerase
VALLERAFGSLTPHSAPGVDRVTWQTYKANLAPHLEALHEKLVNGTYGPHPLVRRLIPQSTGKLRPRGLPALEDTIVAKAVARLREALDEQDVCDFSSGCRPGRRPQHALQEVRPGVRQRIKDGRVLALIEMGRHAGILDGKEMGFPDQGSPQGSVRSPLFANVDVHEVLATWFETVVQAHCRGKGVLSRYADDVVMGCEREEAARRTSEG